LDILQSDIENIVRQVMQQLNVETQSTRPTCSSPIGTEGIFETMEQAIDAASVAQKKLSQLCLDGRGTIIRAMRDVIEEHAEELAKLAVEETGLGKVEHKIKKNLLAARKTPGLEALTPKTFTGDHGLTLVERAPYGIIGSITPSTNPSETIVGNGIGMIAAGNSVVFNCHPGAKSVSELTVRLLNRAITQVGGPPNLLCMVKNPTKESAEVMMKDPRVRILVVTGGSEIVQIAMRTSGKKVIAAGPGNPPVVVDETANIEQAAKHIVDGASFDNNVLCIAEKVTIVVEQVADQLISAMVRQGAFKLSPSQLDKLMGQITVDVNGHRQVNRKYVGKDVQVILSSIGVTVGSDVRLAMAEVPADHPLVFLEQLMPVMPIVRVPNVDQAIELAYQAEQGNFHTAMMHSRNVDNLSKMARRMQVSVFVKNGPSYAGLGMYGEGHNSYTIASPTGEGITTALDFSREVRCVLKDHFRIV
jgi:propionaldehyde dehydrogenase